MVLRENFLLLGLIFFIVFFGAIILLPQSSHAEDSYFFRIDSELDVPIAVGSGATARWTCNGGTGFGIVTDNTASESVQALDGIVKVASTSIENGASRAGCDAGEAIVGSVSMDGWRYRNFSGTVTGAGSNITFTVRASMDYTILINGVTNESGTTLTLNGTTASASYGGTVASQSYRSGKRYIAGSTSGGTVTAGSDGYVNRISSALTISSTATQSVDFGTADDSSLDESGLVFGTKITARRSTYASNPTFTNITGATVTSGDGGGISCTDNADGTYFCVVPLAHTGTAAQASGAALLSGGTGSTSCTYTDRTSGGDAQSTCTITITDPAPGAVPLWALQQPSPPGPPTPLPGATSSLYRRANNPRVYVQGADGLLYWVKTLQDFNAAGYQWKDVQVVSPSTFAQRNIGGKLRVVQGIGYLRIRERPSLSSTVVGRTLSDEEWTFTALENNWYRVQKGGTNMGWVFGDYVSEL